MEEADDDVGELLCTAIVETLVSMWILLSIITPVDGRQFNAVHGTFLYHFGLYFSAKNDQRN